VGDARKDPHVLEAGGEAGVQGEDAVNALEEDAVNALEEDAVNALEEDADVDALKGEEELWS